MVPTGVGFSDAANRVDCEEGDETMDWLRRLWFNITYKVARLTHPPKQYHVYAGNNEVYHDGVRIR